MSADCCSLTLASMPGKIFFGQFLQYLWCALAMLQMVNAYRIPRLHVFTKELQPTQLVEFDD